MCSGQSQPRGEMVLEAWPSPNLSVATSKPTSGIVISMCISINTAIAISISIGIDLVLPVLTLVLVFAFTQSISGYLQTHLRYCF